VRVNWSFERTSRASPAIHVANAGASVSAVRLVRWPIVAEIAAAIILIARQDANFPLAKEVGTPPVP